MEEPSSLTVWGFNKIDSHGDGVGLQIILESPGKSSTVPSQSPLSSTLPSSSSASPWTSSTPSSTLPSSSSASPWISNTRPPPGKVAYICVKSFFDYEWYVFDISDHVEHNQAPPPPKYISYFTPFHVDDDDCPVVNLKPRATAKNLRGRPGWAILGSKSIYMIDERRIGNPVYRIDTGAAKSKLERLPPMPMPMTLSAHTLVVGPKFYSLGGYHLSRKSQSMADAAADEFMSMHFNRSILDGKNSLFDPPLSYPSALHRHERFSTAIPDLFKVYLPSDDELKSMPPWAVAYDPVLNEWECLPDPPYIPNHIIFTAAVEVPEPCIVVGSHEDGLLQIYNVTTKEWEKHEFAISPKLSLGPNALTGSALAIGSRLYWYSVVYYPCLVVYDLMTKAWCVGNFPIHDYGETFAATESDTTPRLAHLNGDEFCLLWVSVVPSVSVSKDDCISRLHCMKLRVTTADVCSKSEIISLDVSILSCQSYMASGFKSFCGGLVVDDHS